MRIARPAIIGTRCDSMPLSSSAKSALLVDGTHFHEPGVTQIANLVAQAMKGLNIGLQGFVN